MTTMVLSPSIVQGFLIAGIPAVGAKLFCYEAGTTATKQAAYTDSTGLTALPNPIILNARGEIAPAADGQSCGLWLDPALGYKFVFAPSTDTDPPTDPIWSVDNVINPVAAVLAALAAYEATLAGCPVGTQLSYGGSSAPTGWLLCAGQAISRTTYSALFAVIGTTYGVGDSSTTFNVPDKRGRASFGKDNMGGSAANRLSTAGSGVDGATLGAAGGSQLLHGHFHTLGSTSHSHGITETAHHHKQRYTGNFPGSGVAEGGVSNAQGPGTVSPDMVTDDASTGLTVNAATIGLTQTEASGNGTSQNMPPAQVDNWIIFAAH